MFLTRLNAIIRVAGNNMDKESIIKLIKETTRQEVGFSSRKLTDTPTDDLMVTPRGYVNLNGVVADRPTSSVATIGQSYFATDTDIPMVYDGTDWRNGIGSIIAAG